jgi:hypothetical protein
MPLLGAQEPPTPPVSVPETLVAETPLQIEQPAPSRLTGTFVAGQLDLLWPQVTPRFPYDFPRGNLHLEPTLAPQATYVFVDRSAMYGGEFGHWLTFRAVVSEGEAWRLRPFEGYGRVRSELTTTFLDWTYRCLEDANGVEEKGKITGRSWWGLRLAYFGIDSDWQSSLLPRQTREQFLGLGPYAAWRWILPLNPEQGNLALFLHLEGTALLGGVKQRDTFLPLDSPSVQAEGQRGRFLFGWQARTGVRWQMEQGNLLLLLRAGYQFEFWSHTGDEIDEQTITYRNGVPMAVDTTFKELTDLLSHGPFLQCEIRY